MATSAAHVVARDKLHCGGTRRVPTCTHHALSQLLASLPWQGSLLTYTVWGHSVTGTLHSLRQGGGGRGCPSLTDMGPLQISVICKGFRKKGRSPFKKTASWLGLPASLVTLFIEQLLAPLPYAVILVSFLLCLLHFVMNEWNPGTSASCAMPRCHIKM